MMISIVDGRYERLLALVTEWRVRVDCTVHELQSAIGRLRHVCYVVREGVSFLGHLIRLTRHHVNRNDTIVVTERARAGFAWFADFLPRFRCRPISDCDWDQPAHFHIVADACLTGYGAYNYEREEYVCGEWSQEILQSADRRVSISMPFLEGLCLTVAQLVWLPYLENRRVVLVSDCEPFVKAARRQYSTDECMLELLQALAMMRAVNNVSVRYDHVSTTDNIVDELSRGDVQAFLRRCPSKAPCKVTSPLLQARSWRDALAKYWMRR
ncbi:MAG TPA: hypothetical protein V6C97_26380 [Oculatellaceae cyanobacterium]